MKPIGRLLSFILAAAATVPLFSQTSATPEGARLFALTRAYEAARPATHSDPTTSLNIDHGPSGTPEESQARADRATAFVKQLSTIDTKALTHDEWIVYGITRYDTEMEAENRGAFFWLPPLVTPYSSPLRALATPFAAAPVRTSGDRTNYLAALTLLPATMDRYIERLGQQLDHGVALPADELRLALPFIRAFAVAPPDSPFAVKPARLTEVTTDVQTAFEAQVNDTIRTKVDPAITKLADYLDGPYRAKAVKTVGVSHYPNGAAYYQYLIHLYTGLELTPQQIQDMGKREVARINTELDGIRKAVNFSGTLADFKTYLRTDRRFYAKTPGEIGDRMMAAIHLIEPKMSAFFAKMPTAPYGVRRLAPELEPSMTYGYYSLPTATDPSGYYNYNGLHPEERSLTMVTAIIFHELMPGHHYQLTLRDENPKLTGIRHTAMFTAYTEGWGEYASDLAGEMGGYPDPYARAGRLGMDLFVSSRLVVDTGMNALGWTRDQAIAYMHENTFESDTQIDTETLRYSADYPGQALAYKLGALKIREMRDRVQAAEGSAFDIRAFHDYLLDAGEMPLNMLDQHFTCFISGEQHHKGS